MSKKRYQSPTLSRFGDVRQLTAGGSAGQSEYIVINFGPFMFDFCLTMELMRNANCPNTSLP